MKFEEIRALLEGKSYKRNDDDERDVKQKKKDDQERRDAKKKEPVEEGKSFKRNKDEDADDKKKKDQERRDAKKQEPVEESVYGARWFNNKGAWQRALRSVDVDDDSDSAASFGGKLVAKWYDDRNEGWVSDAHMAVHEGKSFKRNDDDEEDVKDKRKKDQERRDAKKQEPVEEGKSFKRNKDEDADDKKKKDQERRDAKKQEPVEEGKSYKRNKDEDADEKKKQDQEKRESSKQKRERTDEGWTTYWDKKELVTALKAKYGSEVKAYKMPSNTVQYAIGGGIKTVGMWDGMMKSGKLLESLEEGKSYKRNKDEDADDKKKQDQERRESSKQKRERTDESEGGYVLYGNTGAGTYQNFVRKFASAEDREAWIDRNEGNFQYRGIKNPGEKAQMMDEGVLDQLPRDYEPDEDWVYDNQDELISELVNLANMCAQNPQLLAKHSDVLERGIAALQVTGFEPEDIGIPDEVLDQLDIGDGMYEGTGFDSIDEKEEVGGDEAGPGVGDLKAELYALRAQLSKMGGFDPEGTHVRAKIANLEKKLKSKRQYGKSVLATEGKSYKRNQDDADDKKKQDQDKRQAAKNKRDRVSESQLVVEFKNGEQHLQTEVFGEPVTVTYIAVKGHPTIYGVQRDRDGADLSMVLDDETMTALQDQVEAKVAPQFHQEPEMAEAALDEAPSTGSHQFDYGIDVENGEGGYDYVEVTVHYHYSDGSFATGLDYPKTASYGDTFEIEQVIRKSDGVDIMGALDQSTMDDLEQQAITDLERSSERDPDADRDDMMDREPYEYMEDDVEVPRNADKDLKREVVSPNDEHTGYIDRLRKLAGLR